MRGGSQDDRALRAQPELIQLVPNGIGIAPECIFLDLLSLPGEAG
jgi:hypothetical protein